MSETSLYRRIIAGEAGLWAGPLRSVLRAAEFAYARGVSLRNAWYDRRGPKIVLPVPVISVGNITVGGTGKTPFVIELARRLDAYGRNPAVVSRGYRADGESPNDEERLVRLRCPGVPCVSDPDRIWAAEAAYQKCGADVIILDDGFQHRQLGRSLDIVLVDATCPFGFGHLLPRGLLREPVESLRRAHVIVLTRCDQASPVDLARIEERLHTVVVDPVVIRCRHHVTSVEYLDGSKVDGPFEGKRAVLFAGLGHPRSFATTVRSLGIEVVGTRWWPDHHRYRRRDVERILREDRFPPHDILLTTEKDAVKLVDLIGPGGGRIGVVKVDLDFVDDAGTMLQGVLDSTLQGS